MWLVFNAPPRIMHGEVAVRESLSTPQALPSTNVRDSTALQPGLLHPQVHEQHYPEPGHQWTRIHDPCKDVRLRQFDRSSHYATLLGIRLNGLAAQSLDPLLTGCKRPEGRKIPSTYSWILRALGQRAPHLPGQEVLPGRVCGGHLMSLEALSCRASIASRRVPPKRPQSAFSNWWKIPNSRSR